MSHRKRAPSGGPCLRCVPSTRSRCKPCEQLSEENDPIGHRLSKSSSRGGWKLARQLLGMLAPALIITLGNASSACRRRLMSGACIGTRRQLIGSQGVARPLFEFLRGVQRRTILFLRHAPIE